jgi:hypothetical protein
MHWPRCWHGPTASVLIENAPGTSSSQRESFSESGAGRVTTVMSDPPNGQAAGDGVLSPKPRLDGPIQCWPRNAGNVSRPGIQRFPGAHERWFRSSCLVQSHLNAGVVTRIRPPGVRRSPARRRSRSGAATCSSTSSIRINRWPFEASTVIGDSEASLQSFLGRTTVRLWE